MATGCTIANNTITSLFVDDKPTIFFGTTLAGAAALMGFDLTRNILNTSLVNLNQGMFKKLFIMTAVFMFMADITRICKRSFKPF
jgi:hypothetical protein